MDTISRRGFVSGMAALVGGASLLRFGTGCATANRTFSGIVDLDGFTVPEGEVWQFDPDVSTTVICDGNAIVRGVLVMQPANVGVQHLLQIVGANESAFVGGHTDVPLNSDRGLWVINNGVLIAEGAQKAGWNVTGDDSTWANTDELVAAPNGPTFLPNFPEFFPFAKGSAVPAVTSEGRTYRTEVLNLTRNVRIEGTPGGRAHIQFLHCNHRSMVNNVAIRYMGPQQGGAPVLGRYALHFHMCHEGSRGSLVESVVARDCGSQTFVPHLSNGITMRDCISYNSVFGAYWWDGGDETDDLVWDHCFAGNVRDVAGGNGLGVTAFMLGDGVRMSCTDCAAAQIDGYKTNAGAFHWPSGRGDHADPLNGVWTFNDATAHNCKGAGVSVWQNNRELHLVERFTSYRNGGGLVHGAYSNNYDFRDAVLFGNTINDLEHHATGKTPGIFFRRIRIPKLLITKHSLPAISGTHYLDCKIDRIVVNETHNGGQQADIIEFRSTQPANDLTRGQFNLVSRLSQITVYNSDGSVFAVT